MSIKTLVVGSPTVDESYAMEAWRSSYTVEVWTGSYTMEAMDDCVDSLLGIKHHNDSYAVEVWRSSYNVEVQKGSYTVEEWTIVLICCWVSSTIMIPTPWKHGDVSTRETCPKNT